MIYDDSLTRGPEGRERCRERSQPRLVRIADDQLILALAGENGFNRCETDFLDLLDLKTGPFFSQAFVSVSSVLFPWRSASLGVSATSRHSQIHKFVTHLGPFQSGDSARTLGH